MEDLTSLASLSAEAVVSVLERRVATGFPFTRLGDSVIVKVNPFERLEEDPVRRDGVRVSDLARRAMDRATKLGLAQSCVMTGESGSGKTEAAKAYLAELARDGRCSDALLEERLVASCTLLEEFGNCGTEHNSNSSRFARWFRLRVDEHTGKICGGRVFQCLLEKNRVVTGSSTSSNFHVFYDICAFEGVEKEQFAFLRDRDPEAQGDPERWEEAIEQLRRFGISDSDVDDISGILWLILHLGNLDFDKMQEESFESCKISPTSSTTLAKVRDFLGIGDEKAVEQLFTRRCLSAGRDKVLKKQSVEQAIESRKALAKDLYSRLFSWLVAKMNFSIDADGEQRGHQPFIGILDIFGFEWFEENCFEQLCINFCNERLVQQVHEVLVQAEVNVYLSEGLEKSQIGIEEAYDSEQMARERTLKGIDSVFLTIQDQIHLPKANAAQLAAKLQQFKLGDASKRTRMGNATHFTVNHYAGTVCYSTENFLEKNKDEGPKDIVAILEDQSSNDFLRSLFEDSEIRSNKGRQKAIGVKFKEEFAKLADELTRTEQQFVMCIKPNRAGHRARDVFERDLVQQQLINNGTLSLCKVRQSAFSAHIAHEEFLETYRFLAKTAEAGENVKALVESLISGVETLLDDRDVFLGKTRVLLRAPACAVLENVSKQRVSSATIIQATWRMNEAKKAFKRSLSHVLILQNLVRALLARHRLNFKRQQHGAALKIQRQARRAIASRTAQLRLRSIVKIQSIVRMRLAKIRADSERAQILILQELVQQKLEAEERLRLEIRAVVALQAFWRGFRERQNLTPKSSKLNISLLLQRARIPAGRRRRPSISHTNEEVPKKASFAVTETRACIMKEKTCTDEKDVDISRQVKASLVIQRMFRKRRMRMDIAAALERKWDELEEAQEEEGEDAEDLDPEDEQEQKLEPVASSEEEKESFLPPQKVRKLRLRRLSEMFNKKSTAFLKIFGKTEEKHYEEVAESDPRMHFLLPRVCQEKVKLAKPSKKKQDPFACLKRLNAAIERREASGLTKALREAYEEGFMSGPEIECAEAILAHIRKTHLKQLEAEKAFASAPWN